MVFASSSLDGTGSHLQKQTKFRKGNKKKTWDFRTGETTVPHPSPLKCSPSCSPCLLERCMVLDKVCVV